MATQAANVAELLEAPPQYSERKRILRVFFGRKVSVVGLVIILGLIFTAIFAPQIAPYDPFETNVAVKLASPGPAHWLGTDALGRDTLSRIIYASRTSLQVAVGAVVFASVIGQFLGLIAAYYGAWRFHIIMRLMDGLMSIPNLIMALIISSVLGGGLNNVIIALGVGMVAGQCRMMCAQAMSVKQNDYILASRTTGISSMRMMFVHIFPNAFPPLLVMMTIQLGTAILAEAGLSFLGMGIRPPEAAWGSMINDGYKYLLTNPILSIAPGVAIMLVVFGFNMVGDGLRDALDPRLRGTL
jgi:peptide/nickel transport system permease protein/oligopeptide transport system permease protein